MIGCLKSTENIQLYADFGVVLALDPEIASLRAKADVIRLADELKIYSGIVAGRFQRLTQKWNYFNGIKPKFQWTA